MEEQVAVVDAEHTAVQQQALHVSLQAVADEEGVLQAADELLLLGAEPIGVGRVDGREQGVA